MLRVTHRTTTGRAVAAVLTPTILFFGAMIAVLAIVFTSIATIAARGGGGVGGGSVTMPGPSAVADGLGTYYAAHDSWPATPLEAVSAGVMSGSELLGIVDDPSAKARIGGLNQDDILLGDRKVLARGSTALASVLPKNRPYRLGEAAFCWDGVSPESTGAWLLVVRKRPPPDPLYKVSAIGVGDSVFTDEASFAAALAEENTRRREAGEPEIPPFESITIIRTSP
jgi:hypothetical protein